MMLDDFFTLAELRDGLTSRDRVQDLLIVMQRDKDSVVENVHDASTQWDTVANIIAVTKNQDCLDLFVALDGLRFISRWLKDAYNFRNESGIRDSILKLLTALDKLQVDETMLVCSGILARVVDFLDHDDFPVIYDKAQALCEKWMPNSKQKHETNSVSFNSNDDDDDGGAEEEKEVDSSGCGTSSNPEQHSDRFNIDLNVAADSEDGIPSMRNIDLNLENHSSFPNNVFSYHHNLGNILFNDPTGSRGVQSRDKSGISLFGIEVEDAISQPRNRRILEPALELSLGGSNRGYGVGYGPNGAPTPYMVDPRGGVPPPQFVGPSLAQPVAPGQEPSAFMINVYVGGFQRNNVDLNSGLMNDNCPEGESSWVVGGKRQEPDGGWDGFSGDHKHQRPPWK